MDKLHTDRDYEQQLADLREGLLLMAGRVEEMIDNAIKALVERDVPLAKATMEADHLVNRAEVHTDELCLLILAKRQPMASDLRFVTLSLKMVTDLERIGDLAVNLCERAIDLASEPWPGQWEKVPRMAEIARTMVGDAIDAFITADVDKASAVIARDDEVDRLYRSAFDDVLGRMMADATLVPRGVHVLSIAKWIERTADHATNLAEQVVFMVKGKDIRHMGSL